MIQSPICELLGICYPVFQGGMPWIADGKMAAAVSNGGGIGIIAAVSGELAQGRINILDTVSFTHLTLPTILLV